jgi:hypothetical protein
VLDEVRGPDTTAREHHNEQLDASRTVHTRVDQLSEVLERRAEALESAMKEQEQLILALKSFLEDKASRSEAAQVASVKSVRGSEYQTSWPPSTLSTAYFAALLLSSVLSSVAVTSIVTGKHRGLSGTSQPVFLPVDHNLPGLGPLNKIQGQPSFIHRVDNTATPMSAVNSMVSAQVKAGWSRSETISSTQARPKEPTPTQAAEWVQDYSRTQKAVRQPNEQPSKPERRETVGPYPTWARR